MARSLSNKFRFQILERDGFKCFYCQVSEVLLEVDHVIPVSRGGTDDTWNLAASCRPCNASKSNTAPDELTIRRAYEADYVWITQRRSHPYRQCRECGKPINVSDWEDIKEDCIQCERCNEMLCDAFMDGYRSGYKRAGEAV